MQYKQITLDDNNSAAFAFIAHAPTTLIAVASFDHFIYLYV